MKENTTRRRFMKGAAAAGMAALTGCETPSSGSGHREDQTLEETASETLEPQSSTLEEDLEEFQEELSAKYSPVEEVEDEVRLTDRDGDGQSTIQIDIDVEELLDYSGSEVENPNALDVLMADDMPEFSQDISGTFASDIFMPLMQKVGDHRSEVDSEGYDFINIEMHAAEDTSFSLTVDAETAYRVAEGIEDNPSQEDRRMGMLMDTETAVKSPEGIGETVYVPEGGTKEIEVEGDRYEIKVENVHTDEEGKEWADIDIDGDRDDYHTDEGTVNIVDGKALVREINPSPYSEGVKFEVQEDGLAAHHDCDPADIDLKDGQSTTYTHEGEEYTIKLEGATDEDTGILKINGEPHKVSEGEIYSVEKDLRYEVEEINPEADIVAELRFKEVDCYQ